MLPNGGLIGMAHFEGYYHTLAIGNNNNHTLSYRDHKKQCQTHTIEKFGKEICKKNMYFSTSSITVGGILFIFL